MKEQTKFRSGVNKKIFIGLAVYHLAILVSFILPIFLWRNIVSWYGILLIIINIIYLFPLIFNTYYSLNEKELFIFQWPLTRIKIPYNKIFIIDNDFPSDAQKKATFGFSEKLIVIGYEAEVMNRKEKKITVEKRYVAISPADYDSFMIKMGGKFSSAKAVAKKLEGKQQENNQNTASENKVVEFVGTLKKRNVRIKEEKEKQIQEKIEDAQTVVVSSSKGVSSKVKIIDTDETDKNE